MVRTSYSGLGTFVVVASWIEAGGAWSCSYLAFEMDKKGDMSSTTTLRPVFSHPFLLSKILGEKNANRNSTDQTGLEPDYSVGEAPDLKRNSKQPKRGGRNAQNHDKQTNERTIIRE
jgi:hypothetical protein